MNINTFYLAYFPINHHTFKTKKVENCGIHQVRIAPLTKRFSDKSDKCNYAEQTSTSCDFSWRFPAMSHRYNNQYFTG